jgi:hypothetical protein
MPMLFFSLHPWQCCSPLVAHAYDATLSLSVRVIVIDIDCCAGRRKIHRSALCGDEAVEALSDDFCQKSDAEEVLCDDFKKHR